MKNKKQKIGIFLAIVMTIWFLWFTAVSLPAIDLSTAARPKVWITLVVASILYALIIPISAIAWSKLLAAKGTHFPASSLAILMGRTQLAKYIPGNVAQHGLRMALAIRAGIPLSNCATTILQETVLAVLASILVGVVAFSVVPIRQEFSGQVDLFRKIMLLLIAILALVSLMALANIFAKRWKNLSTIELPALKVTIPVFALYAVNYLLIGIGLTMIARSVEMPTSFGFAATTGAFSLAWTLGFLAPGAPAGMGVREGIMAALLLTVEQTEDIFVFLVLVRFMTMIGDAICFLVAWATGITRPEAE